MNSPSSTAKLFLAIGLGALLSGAVAVALYLNPLSVKTDWYNLFCMVAVAALFPWELSDARGHYTSRQLAASIAVGGVAAAATFLIRADQRGALALLQPAAAGLVIAYCVFWLTVRFRGKKS